MMKAFQRVILLPRPEYGTRLCKHFHCDTISNGFTSKLKNDFSYTALSIIIE
jgi:hypothetical protein